MFGRALLPLLLTFSLFAPHVRANSCLLMEVKEPSHTETRPIFRGTIVRVENVPHGQIIEFEVHRVWKGPISRRFVMH
jgi:hypothetical protein